MNSKRADNKRSARSRAVNKPVLGNTLDYYNDDMSRRAVGKLFDNLDDFAEDSERPSHTHELKNTTSIVVGYDDTSTEHRERSAPVPVSEPLPTPAEPLQGPSMERVAERERAAGLADGRPKRTPEPESERPSRSRAFADEGYDMGMYRRGHSFINNEEYEELMRPRPRIKRIEPGHEGHLEPAIIHRASQTDNSKKPSRHKPVKSDSDEYLERAQVHRDHNEMRKAANAYHRSRLLRPYIMGLFVIMMVAMALMLFRIITLTGRVTTAEAEQLELQRSIEGYMAMQLENSTLKEEVSMLNAIIDEMQEPTSPAGEPEEGIATQPEQQPDQIELPTRYTVVAGDNLSRISNRFYGTTDNWLQIMEANGMTSDVVTPGLVLIIPEL